MNWEGVAKNKVNGIMFYCAIIVLSRNTLKCIKYRQYVRLNNHEYLDIQQKRMERQIAEIPITCNYIQLYKNILFNSSFSLVQYQNYSCFYFDVFLNQLYNEFLRYSSRYLRSIHLHCGFVMNCNLTLNEMKNAISIH